MDYVRDDFGLKRLSPGGRRLELPMQPREATSLNTPGSPIILRGRIYRGLRGELLAVDEASLRVVAANKEHEYRYTLLDYSDGTFMVSDKARNSYVIDCESMKIVSVFSQACLLPEGQVVEGVGSLQSYSPFAGRGLRDRIYFSYSQHIGEVPAWTFSPETGAWGFAVAEDKIVYRTYRGTFYLLDLFTANVLWKKTPRELGYLSDEDEEAELGIVNGNPRIFGDLVITAMHGYVVAFRLETGEVVWKRRGYAGGFNPCVSEDGLVYWVWYERIAHKKKAFDLWHFAILDALTGKELKLCVLNPPESDAEKKIFTRPLANGEHMYGDVTTTHYWCALYGGLLLAINLETGAIDWHYDFKDIIYPKPFIICNNRLYIQSFSKDYVFEGEGGYRPD